MHSTVTRVLPWDVCLFAFNQTPPVACNHWTRASYVVWNECVVPPSLQEVDRNVTTGDIRNWNILDAMWGISLAWKLTMPAIIQAHFAKCGICPGSSLNTNSNEKCEWEDLQSHIDYPSTSNRFFNVDECVPTTGDHPTGLDFPGPRSLHVIDEEQQKTGESWLLPIWPCCKAVGCDTEFECCRWQNCESYEWTARYCS